jgi:hypothetical protein
VSHREIGEIREALFFFIHREIGEIREAFFFF